MIANILTKVIGSKNERELNKIKPFVEKINAFEPQTQAMSDEQLKAQTELFKERLNNGESIDDILPEAFATVRETSVRTLDMRHFDAQLIGGVALHQGKIAEMKTGEGKTLAATLPAYLNSLSNRGVHIITVNDYLAKRDTEWMGYIYNFLGLSVGCILHGLNEDERDAAYSADITYGTNNEFGFDYLRDNMKFGKDDIVQGELNFAIVDEVDSILIDEARTPLIISGPAEKSTDLYHLANGIIPRFVLEQDYTLDEKARSAVLTEEGIAKSEKILKVDNLYDPKHIELLHHINQALKAYTLFKRDVDYIVKNGEVIIVDEFTGRLMPGRRYSEGLHQALEAKENVKIENENQTLATITFQNYFRMYNKLAGMTGTADTEAAEFKKIYGLDVLVIPTNQPMIRIDNPDVIYKTRREKFDAVIDEIVELHKKGQPALVGTISIDVSENFSKKLKKRSIKHSVLNAKNHEGEAEIIALAGQRGAVTISTNMAGRGTDIVLGEGVTKLGGLHIIGTERHESRRIDNQLRGRSGRQGDPGSSRFYLSLEDDLLRIFGSERISSIMERLGMEEGEPIEHALISRGIENAQRKVEGHNFDIRKHLLEYDDVMNKHREIIYSLRKDILDGHGLGEIIEGMIDEKVAALVEKWIDPKEHSENWEIQSLTDNISRLFGFRLKIGPEDIGEEAFDGLKWENLTDLVGEQVRSAYQQKEKLFGKEDLEQLERFVILQIIDNQWVAHLQDMEHMKEGIGLRGYGQLDPLKEYQKEGFALFGELMDRIREETLNTLFRIQLIRQRPEEIPRKKKKPLQLSHGGDGSQPVTVRRKEKKVGRNAPCPCGSGKKYKKCCGANK